MQIHNKVFIVTGAGSGIGKSLTLKLIEKGAKVAAIDNRKSALDELSKQINSEGLSTHTLDITDKKAVDNLPKEIIKKQGQVDAIINNAGIIQPFVRINNLDYSDIEKVMNVNFYGALYMVKAFLPTLLERPEGYIANVSSMGGFLPVPGQSIYGASKAAVKLMTEGLYAELVDTNVNVSIIFPGATETNITENSGVKALSVGSEQKSKITALPADNAAEIIIRGIEENRPRIIVGKDSKLMDKLYRISPKFATNFIAKQMKSLLEK